MNQIHPQRSKQFIESFIQDELLLLDTKQNTVHILNESSRFVWQLCDGKHTPVDIETTLKEAYVLPDGHDVTQDVENILYAFSQAGLIAEIAMEAKLRFFNTSYPTFRCMGFVERGGRTSTDKRVDC